MEREDAVCGPQPARMGCHESAPLTSSRPVALEPNAIDAMTDKPIYLDNHATTRVDPRVVEAMLPCFLESFGNPGSINHAYGWEARDLVEAARARIAALIGATEREIVFTSGATESNNLALKGVAERLGHKGKHIVSVKTEHKSVLDPLRRLARRGFEVTLLDVAPAGSDCPGWLDPEQVQRALRPDTILVSVMLANNEIGVIQPIAEIAPICRAHGVLLHCDATQAVGKIPVHVKQLGVHLMSFSGHKIYGPKGIGALYVERSPGNVRLEPQIDGGGQEWHLRSGTLNVPGIVGLARALELCIEELPHEMQRLRRLRDRLFEQLAADVPDLVLNGPPLEQSDRRLPGNLNCGFPGVDGEALILNARDVAVSSGSACTSADPEPSHVLRALGLNDDLVRASLRFGIGRFNTESDIDRAARLLAQEASRLRKLVAS
ncbi:MAG: cysteine desulfurase IscS [Pirellulaceae bacterium]|nr:MAG: cysteine desulfurase IscS [Pirellulaceae bacterium]